MGSRNMVLGVVAVCAVVAGCLAVGSPAWAADPQGSSAGCRIEARNPAAGRSVKGYGSRSGCSDTVTYFWVRVYRVVDWWPDSEVAVKGLTYVQNGNLTATGACAGRGEHYTYTSTATGASGDSVESGRVVLC
jgi:hypothetical protein